MIAFTQVGYVGSKTGRGYGYKSGRCTECAAWVPADLDHEGDGKGWAKHVEWHDSLRQNGPSNTTAEEG